MNRTQKATMFSASILAAATAVETMALPHLQKYASAKCIPASLSYLFAKITGWILIDCDVIEIVCVCASCMIFFVFIF